MAWADSERERENPEGEFRGGFEAMLVFRLVDVSSESSEVGVRKQTVWVDVETCV